jgi:phospholipase/lecithinase/hemolysin
MKACVRTLFLAVAIVLVLPLAGVAQTIDRIVFFGDSLSDSGNHFIFTGQSTSQPFPLGPPDSSYNIGGHHFSNGNTWAEQLATALHLPTSGNPSLRRPGVFTNYAVGQARARAGAPTFSVFDLQTQVQEYLADFGGQVDPGTLVAIWIGGNDVSDALMALVDPAQGLPVAQGILAAAGPAVANAVTTLYAAGARMFLIVNVPDFAYTPYVRFLDATMAPGIAGAATSFTTSFDAVLAQIVASLFTLPPDPVHPLRFATLLDANALIGQIVTSPESFGIANATDRCTTPGIVGHAICSTPHRYLFWDGIHPTSTGHHAVAEAALQLLPPQ